MDKKDAHRREHRKGKRNITPVPLFRFFYLRRLSEKNANNREAGNSETLAERLQQQYRYDPIRAYRKLKNYRRRRRIRRYSVAAGILLVLGLGWGWFHQNSPGDPLLLTQTIQPGGKKAVLTLADGSVWHIGDSAMLIPTAQNHIRIDSSGMLLQAGKEGKTENT